MMKKLMMIPVLMLSLSLMAAPAMAKPDVKISITAEKEITVEENGKTVVKRVKADSAQPGEVVVFTLNYSNHGDEAATDVKLVDPIPADMAYVTGSAYGPGAEVTFSVDGKKFDKESKLSYEAHGQKVVASPDEYTHIRWIVKKVEAGKSGTAGFRAKVK